MFGADRDKSQFFFVHLLAAAQRHERKVDARERLKTQLGKLKDLKLDDSIKQQIAILERSVNDVVNTERQILRVQDSERRIDQAVAYRLGVMERKLDDWKSVHKKKEQALTDLEKRIDARLKKTRVVRNELPNRNSEQKWKDIERAAQVRRLKSGLVALERLYRNLSHQKGVSKAKLAQVDKRIRSIKSTIKKME
ncbi:hypothetical protein HY641_00185 [Candidatus Woesearchaeota archaeon]|nr:hypothetical protein [Candidatus Woesearchaeota archaeon]